MADDGVVASHHAFSPIGLPVLSLVSKLLPQDLDETDMIEDKGRSECRDINRDLQEKFTYYGIL